MKMQKTLLAAVGAVAAWLLQQLLLVPLAVLPPGPLRVQHLLQVWWRHLLLVWWQRPLLVWWQRLLLAWLQCLLLVWWQRLLLACRQLLLPWQRPQVFLPPWAVVGVPANSPSVGLP
jgi:hypothetical protein